MERHRAAQGATVYELAPGMPSELGSGQDIRFEESAYEMGAGAQGDFDSPVLRLRYSSLSTPSSTIDYNMRTRERCAPSSNSHGRGAFALRRQHVHAQEWRVWRGQPS